MFMNALKLFRKKIEAPKKILTMWLLIEACFLTKPLY